MNNLIFSIQFDSISDANESSFGILASANELGGYICKTYYKIMGSMSGFAVLISTVSVLLCYKMHGRFDAQYTMHTARLM